MTKENRSGLTGQGSVTGWECRMRLFETDHSLKNPYLYKSKKPKCLTLVFRFNANK
jgi:hypothetical protein